MRISNRSLSVLWLSLIATATNAQLLDQSELEDGSLLPGYSSVVETPFNSVATFANGDGVEINTQLSGVPGKFRLDVSGASSHSNAAGISVYLGDKKIGASEFSGTSLSTSSISFTLESNPSNSTLKFVLETDNGSNDTYLDAYELHRTGDIPAPPAAPILPSEGAYKSGIYRNMFAELGYDKQVIKDKLDDVYDQLFHSTNTGKNDGEAIFIPVGSDMAYIWDTGNNDVRSEGMSYGMMMALQMDRQDDFDKLWKWAHTYSLNKTGGLKGYFAWKVSTAGQVLDAAPAPDGEEYFATALFFAAHRWGNGAGIYNYEAQANSILKDMFGNGEFRYNNSGVLEERSLFNHAEKQIVFSPATPTDRNWTDTSYHLPAFYELWAKWADNNNEFWAEIADVSRQHFKDAAHPTKGLTPDYAYFDGTPHGEFQHWKDTFQYDAWRVISNVAMDYAWWKKDEWQVTQVKRLQTFFKSQGINSYSSLYELDGVPYNGNKDHSPGLVAMNAVASLASDSADAWEFVDALWNTNIPEGQHRYYDGSLYMFGMLAMSGNYRIYCPNNECDSTTDPIPSNRAPVANADSASTTENIAVIVNVLANDTDVNGDVISIVSFTKGENGSVSKSGDNLIYTPNTNYSGSDKFSYKATDGTSNSTSAMVTVTITAEGVNVAPIAINDAASTAINTSVTIDVLANDNDADGDIVSINNYSQAMNGSVSQNGDSLMYTPNDSFVGTDTFTYTATDSMDTSTTATVNVSVSEEVVTNPGEDIAFFEMESGTISPSYRQPMNTPFEGVILYGNNEQVSFSQNLSAGDYSLVINGASNSNTEAGISIYVDGNKVGATSFNSSLRTEKKVAFTINNATSEITFKLESDVGQNDTLLDWFKIFTGNVVTDPGTPETPDTSGYINIPSQVEAESYVAESGTQTENASDNGGGLNVGYIQDGDYLDFDVNVTEAGTYTVEFRVATNTNGGDITLLNGSTNLGSISVSNTGGWQNWQTITTTVRLEEGTQRLRTNFTGNSGYLFNFNYVNFVK